VDAGAVVLGVLLLLLAEDGEAVELDPPNAATDNPNIVNTATARITMTGTPLTFLARRPLRSLREGADKSSGCSGSSLPHTELAIKPLIQFRRPS
jgi:hypothetical protein